jgi:type VI secretion system protein ImpA
MISVDDLLKPISPEQPCGEDFTYQPSFQEMETLVRGKPETQFSQAEDPNWKELRDLSISFFGQSKHLSAGVILSLCLLKTDGFAGLRDGLTVLRGLLEKYWDAVYPKLDPDDNNDPTERVNILNNLSSFGEPYRFILRLQQTPICDSRGMGRVTLGDVLAAKERAAPAAPAEGAEPAQKAGPNDAQIQAAFRDSEPEALKAAYEAISQSVETVKGMDAFLTQTIGAGGGANFDELTKTLVLIQRSLAPHVAGATVEQTEEESAQTASGNAGGRSKAYTGKIQSRDDVVAALEQVCDYYRQCEPSSPIPFIVQRAQRMVKMNFMEIVSELTPDAMTHLKVITGSDGETSAPPST